MRVMNSFFNTEVILYILHPSLEDVGITISVLTVPFGCLELNWKKSLVWDQADSKLELFQ